jgi:HD superfamily phosphodiesterase
MTPSERINKIIQHPHFIKHYENIVDYENDRIYCKHDMSHFLDVCRIAYIVNCEYKLGISKDLIYAAGLLHDIGRDKEYEDGTPHNEASAIICGKILKDAGFSLKESILIKKAIHNHRHLYDHATDIKKPKDLSDVIYLADKRSRPCLTCPVEDSCNWDTEKKNMELIY